MKTIHVSDEENVWWSWDVIPILGTVMSQKRRTLTSRSHMSGPSSTQTKSILPTVGDLLQSIKNIWRIFKHSKRHVQYEIQWAPEKQRRPWPDGHRPGRTLNPPHQPSPSLSVKQYPVSKGEGEEGRWLVSTLYYIHIQKEVTIRLPLKKKNTHAHTHTHTHTHSHVQWNWPHVSTR
jgi:hypothetical protein